MDFTTRQKIEEKFVDHGSPQALVQLMDVDELDAVERLKKVKSKEMKRSDFVKLCVKTIKEIRPEFIQDWKNLRQDNLSLSPQFARPWPL